MCVQVKAALSHYYPLSAHPGPSYAAPETQKQESPETGYSLPGNGPIGHQVPFFIQQLSSLPYPGPEVPVRYIPLLQPTVND